MDDVEGGHYFENGGYGLVGGGEVVGYFGWCEWAVGLEECEDVLMEVIDLTGDGECWFGGCCCDL